MIDKWLKNEDLLTKWEGNVGIGLRSDKDKERLSFEQRLHTVYWIAIRDNQIDILEEIFTQFPEHISKLIRLFIDKKSTVVDIDINSSTTKFLLLWAPAETKEGIIERIWTLATYLHKLNNDLINQVLLCTNSKNKFLYEVDRFGNNLLMRLLNNKESTDNKHVSIHILVDACQEENALFELMQQTNKYDLTALHYAIKNYNNSEHESLKLILSRLTGEQIESLLQIKSKSGIKPVELLKNKSKALQDLVASMRKKQIPEIINISDIEDSDSEIEVIEISDSESEYDVIKLLDTQVSTPNIPDIILPDTPCVMEDSPQVSIYSSDSEEELPEYNSNDDTLPRTPFVAPDTPSSIAFPSTPVPAAATPFTVVETEILAPKTPSFDVFSSTDSATSIVDMEVEPDFDYTTYIESSNEKSRNFLGEKRKIPQAKNRLTKYRPTVSLAPNASAIPSHFDDVMSLLTEGDLTTGYSNVELRDSQIEALQHLQAAAIKHVAAESSEKAALRGYFDMPTGSGKTFLFSCIMTKILESTNGNILVISPEISLCNQLEAEVKKFIGNKQGLATDNFHIIHSGNVDKYTQKKIDLNDESLKVKDNKVVIAVCDSIAILCEKNPDALSGFHTIIVDETHVEKGDFYQKLNSVNLKASLILGFSATPGKYIEFFGNNLLYKLDDKTAHARKEISSWVVQDLELGEGKNKIPSIINFLENAKDAYGTPIVNQRGIIYVSRSEDAENLEYAIRHQLKKRACCITTKSTDNDSSTKQYLVQAFKDGKYDILIAVRMFQIGLDVKNLDFAMIAKYKDMDKISNKLEKDIAKKTARQIAGRAIRFEDERPDKIATIIAPPECEIGIPDLRCVDIADTVTKLTLEKKLSSGHTAANFKAALDIFEAGFIRKYSNAEIRKAYLKQYKSLIFSNDGEAFRTAQHVTAEGHAKTAALALRAKYQSLSQNEVQLFIAREKLNLFFEKSLFFTKEKINDQCFINFNDIIKLRRDNPNYRKLSQAEIRKKEGHGSTVLIHCIINGWYDHVRLLLSDEYKLNPNAVCSLGKNPAHYAMQFANEANKNSDKYKIYDLLINKLRLQPKHVGAQVSTPVRPARPSRPQVDPIRAQRIRAYNAAKRKLEDFFNESSFTKNKINNVVFIAKEGVWHTALTYCIKQGLNSHVRMLFRDEYKVRYGLNPNTPSSEGKTPAHYAMEYRNEPKDSDKYRIYDFLIRQKQLRPNRTPRPQPASKRKKLPLPTILPPIRVPSVAPPQRQKKTLPPILKPK